MTRPKYLGKTLRQKRGERKRKRTYIPGDWNVVHIPASEAPQDGNTQRADWMSWDIEDWPEPRVGIIESRIAWAMAGFIVAAALIVLLQQWIGGPPSQS